MGLSAAADPVGVTYTVSGSPRAWVYDFSVTNNIGGTNDIYFFGVKIGNTDVVGSPSGWAFSQGDTRWTPNSGSGITYDNTRCCNDSTSILLGQTVSGFEVQGTSASALNSIQWFAHAAFGIDTNADGHFNPRPAAWSK
jgi:hypothetical protein